MQAIIEELARQAEADLAQVASKETLAAFWQKYLSKAPRHGQGHQRAETESAGRL